ncbi:hypothetical protein CK203_021947 [Vitis vinifera]|uniref:Reverse transcriptase zinc-binding domain-containing protein n=1 Tax=Vitis vinifera TaxID=29760 RepID=A0A438JFG6_VITVI|nr:hypothetical protein CK203_021947 [Vitis vinifera]
MRNIALLGKWLWRFPRERNGLWHKVIASIYGTHPNGWDANTVVRDGHTDVLGRLLLKFSRIFPFCPPSGGQWGENSFLGRSLIQERGLYLRQVVFSEIFFLGLVKSLNPLMFLPAKFLWSSKVPSKVKALAWLVAHGKVNTNDKLQLRRPYKALCPQWCILCKGNGESSDHIFLHCPLPLDFGTERNNRIFEDKGRTEEMVWDLIRFYSSLWASCMKLLEEFL